MISSEPFNKEVVREQLESDPWYYFGNTRQMEYTEDGYPFQNYNAGSYYIPEGLPDIPKSEAISATNRLLGTTQIRSRLLTQKSSADLVEQLMTFALMDTPGAFFEKVGEATETMETSHRRGSDSEANLDDGTPKVDNREGEALKYRYVQKYKMIRAVEADSQIINEMLLWYEKRSQTQLFSRPTTYPRGKYKESLTYFTKDTMTKRVLMDQMRYIDVLTGLSTRRVTNSLFLDGMLRIKEANEMRRADFAAMIATGLEVDYKAEDPSFIEKVFSAAVIILAVVVTIVTWGSGAPAMAAALSYGGMILSVGVLMLSMFGGLSAQSLAKSIGAFAQIVGYVTVILGIYALIQNAGKILATKAAEEAGLQAGTEAFTNMVKDEMLQQTLIDQVSALVTQSLESVTSSISKFVTMDLSQQVSFISDGLDFINTGFEFYADHEKKELQDDIDKLQEEEDKYNAEMLSDSLKSPMAVYEQVEERLTSYDALNEHDIKVSQVIGMDKNYLAWYTNVNT